MRLYIPFAFEKEIILTEKLHHYIHNVMRCNVGDTVIVFNEKVGEFGAFIKEQNKKKTILSVGEQIRQPQQENISDSILYVAPIKRMQMVVEKATELGIREITPVITDYSNAKTDLEKMKAWAIEASEQCERISVPQVNPPQKLKKVLDEMDRRRVVYFANERVGEEKASIISNQPVGFLVGPEGGFSQAEKDMILSYPNIKNITLGSLILRTETAVIALLSKVLIN